MKKKFIYGVITSFFTTPIYADIVELETVTVRSSGFERQDTETTYASEIHTAKQIEASGASTLYDYLAQQTSLNLLSNFGSRATPSINLRGFGGENGYQNVVITVDGQRLNNIDMVPQLISAIPIVNIERIEISKGSGSVLYGDGATAGAIQIYTKNKTGVTVVGTLGNFGQQNHAINAGLSEQYFDLSATAAHDSHNGFSKRDITGEKDKSDSDTQNVKLKIKPTESFRLMAEGTSSRNNIGYANLLSKAQFEDDPRQAGSRAYTRQQFNTDQWRVGFEYDLTKSLKLTAAHFREDKESRFPSFASNYDYRSNQVALNYKDENLGLILGFQNFEGLRATSFDDTSKNNTSFYVQSEYIPRWISDKLTVSAGLRDEQVRYKYRPEGAQNSKISDNLNAWDVGANFRFDERLSAFVNYNKGFQAPDIDRFFKFDSSTFETQFSGFIKPVESRTFNLGLNHVTQENRLKATLFYTRLNNEIYFDPTFVDPILAFTGMNANIDKSHKYGLELQDFFVINNQLSGSIIYNFTKAVIDNDIAANGTRINDKTLPGVPKQTIVANLNWKFYENATLNINHTWRSKAYIYNDFQNNASQRQDRFESTNIALSYQLNKITAFAAINNIFEHENNIQTGVDAIYPVDFVRTVRVGVRADF